MRHGIHISAGTVWLLVLVVVGLVALVAAKERPELQRYLKMERM